DKVAELRQDPTLAIQQSHPKHTIQRMTKPALQQVQEAIRMSIEHATSLHWPPLYQEPLEA
ncbi:MAG TPA: hypothetical protein DCE42_29485, partial [Myxococcales bacterium]|nr:hypothetical protein [Myxococcales bacterium]